MTHIIVQSPQTVNNFNFPQDGPQIDPQGGYQVILNGEAVAWSDDLPTAWRSYHELVNEPIPVYANDELAFYLEMYQ